eukprot:COSAG02_NODE_2667_length_8294_cov_305.833435_7_plen_123_part_00
MSPYPLAPLIIWHISTTFTPASGPAEAAPAGEALAGGTNCCASIRKRFSIGQVSPASAGPTPSDSTALARYSSYSDSTQTISSVYVLVLSVQRHALYAPGPASENRTISLGYRIAVTWVLQQ